jgi:hypothetical protein
MASTSNDLIQETFLVEPNKNLPPAPERLEKLAQKLMSSGLSAEGYAGQHGSTILACSIHRYQYQFVETHDWVQRLGYILGTPNLLAQYQEKYLTPEEWEAVKKDANDNKKHY